MSLRLVGLLGIRAWLLFWSALVVFGALRPSYSQVVNTVSELGAIGTSNAVLWNVCGFIVPGIVLAFVGATIARTANTKPSATRTLATAALALCGLAVAAQGIMPAAMADGVADTTSLSTLGHFVSSVISGLAWAVGAVLLVGPMRRDPDWRGLYLPSVVLVALGLGSALALRGTIPDGLAQRLGNTPFCAWFVVMSLKLVRIGASGPARRTR